MYECKICGSTHERFKTIEGLYRHLEREHESEIPADWTVEQFAYYLRTGKSHGTCVICHGDTKFNPATGKYCRMCGKKACADKNREIFKQRMIGRYGKVSLLDDPEQQKKMLANRKISGNYKWSDGGVKTYTGSYELDFLKFLDVMMDYPSEDVISPSPHTYYYTYEGKKHFYIPDFYITSINLEVEIKDGGSNPNMHHKIQEVDKEKERLKDQVMMTQNAVSYVKITDKAYNTFFEYLMELKKQYNDKKEGFKPIFILGESYTQVEESSEEEPKDDKKEDSENTNDTTDYSDSKDISDSVDVSGNDVLYYASRTAGLSTIQAKKSSANPNLGNIVIASPYKEYAATKGLGLSKNDFKISAKGGSSSINIEVELLNQELDTDRRFSMYVLDKKDFKPMVINGKESSILYVKKGPATVIRESKPKNWRKYINRFSSVKLTNFPNDTDAKEKKTNKLKESYTPLLEEANYSSKNKYPVFIILMHSGTMLANVIKEFTRNEFSHSCISFNSDLNPMYSFGNKKVDVLDTGFVIQSPDDPFYKKFKAYYNVYVMYVDKKTIDKMKRRLQFFIDNRDKLKYDLPALIACAAQVPTEYSKKYFCSRFVMDIIGEGQPIPKAPSLWTPQQIASLDNISLVDKGVDFLLYDKEYTEKALKKIKAHNFDFTPLHEALMTTKERNALPDEEFGLPKIRKYPLSSKEKVLSAIKFFNYVDKENEKELADNINKKIKEYELTDIHVGKNNRFSDYYVPTEELTITPEINMMTPAT